MKKEFLRKQTSIYFSLGLSILALFGFMYQSKILFEPLVLFAISIFVLFPYRNESRLIKRILLLIIFLFVGWLISVLGVVLIPFIVSFMIAYLLDPFVTRLSSRIPRWLSAGVIILAFVGIVSVISVFVFPSVFLQLDSAINKITLLVSSVSGYIESDSFYAILGQFGLQEQTAREMVNNELMPKLQNIITAIFSALMSFMNSMSGLASQVLNAILIPILSFYLVKDFNKVKELVKTLLKDKNQKLLYDLRRGNIILRKYIGWQIIAATIVAVCCSIAFTLFGIPYPIVLGIICGLFNPIPYVGFVTSMIITVLTIIIVSPEDIWLQIFFALAVINLLHFINTYFLEPNIIGRQVGLHPVVLIGSLFIFGGLFGIVGLLIAVPTTAILVMFFNDWRNKLEEDRIIQN